MSMLGILIGTGILWGISALVVNPLVQMIVNRKLATIPELVPVLQGTAEEVELTDDQMNRISSMATQYFILVDTAVLGLTGLFIGLFTGFFFIGFSWNAKSWPGMIAFIVASFFGSSMYVG